MPRRDAPFAREPLDEVAELSVTEVLPEERVVGRYVLGDEIAAGGMASVHLGRMLGSVGFARTVAIKRLHPQFAKNPEFASMLLDEARVTGRIRHPNVVTTLDVVADESELLIVMEYVAGESLAHLLRATFAANERPPLGVMMSVIAGVLYGLHAAHDATDDQGEPLGVIHRDVSPQNILVGADGVARVLDFGVAKAVGQNRTTREGTLKGKLAYMSPEQVEGEPLDRRSDVFSAAVVLWEMLVGQRLFRAENEAATLRKILTYAPPPPCTLVPELPPAVDALVMNGLAADRESRFETAWEMAEAAQRVAFATTGEVSAWVQRFGAETMAKRAERVTRLERRAAAKAAADVRDAPALGRLARAAADELPVSDERPTYEADPTVIRSTADASAVATRDPGLRAPSPVHPRVRGRIVAGGLGVAFVVLAFIGSRACMSAAPEDAVVSAALPSAPASAVTPPPAALPPASAAPPDIAPSASLPAAAPTHAVASTTAAVAPRRPAAPRSKCNPPYTVDPNGIRIPKAECL